MQSAELPNGEVVLIVNRDELRLVNNALNEGIEELDDEEFRIRVGSTKDDARTLRRQFRELYNRLSPVS